MSLKKTWFSYVLWMILTGLTVLITYLTLSEVIFDIFGMVSLSFTKWSVYLDIGFKLLITIVVVALCFLLHYLCSKVKLPIRSKWVVRVFHIIMFLSIAAAFILTRLPAVMNPHTQLWSKQASCFYQASIVGAEGAPFNFPVTMFEQAYINVLSGLFLFLGNKVVVLQYFQPFLQSISLILLIVIGWTLQKGIYAWIPAVLYAVSPFSFYAVEDVGPTNFWMCIVLICIACICLLEKAWKNKNITYIILVIFELLFGIFVLLIKSGVLLYGKMPFVSGGEWLGTNDVIYIELLIVAVLLIFYCVSFWFNKQDHKTLFILPFVGLSVLLIWLSFYEFDVSYFLMMSVALNFYILTAESLRVILKFKPEVLTGQIEVSRIEEMASEHTEENEELSFEWSEMQEVMKESKNLEKIEAVQVKVEIPVEESVLIDRTAPIENVLPMPKKHKPKVFDYAFEPSEEQMHYDVEIENDDYDY